jgi:hypothetical protein
LKLLERYLGQKGTFSMAQFVNLQRGLRPSGRSLVPVVHLEKFRHCPRVGVPYRFDPEHIAALKVSTAERLENLKNAVMRPP